MSYRYPRIDTLGLQPKKDLKIVGNVIKLR